MGYAIVIGICVGCGKTFGYNPNLVPSVRINGRRREICQECVNRVNPLRKKRGLEPIVPHPDAYGPIPEHEL